MEKMFLIGGYRMIGNKIKKIRKFRGYTQRELGLLCGYKINSADVMIAKYEAGDRIPSKKTINKIASVLNVPVSLFDCNIKENIGILELGDLLLWLEEFGEKIDFLFENNRISVIIENPEINEYLRMWQKKNNEYKAGEISLYEYCNWKYTVMPLILGGKKQKEENT